MTYLSGVSVFVFNQLANLLLEWNPY